MTTPTQSLEKQELKRQLIDIESRYGKRIIDLENQLEISIVDSTRQENVVQKLKNERFLLVKKVEELTSLFDKVQGEFRNFKTESESTVAKLRRENMELKEHCRDAQEMLQSVQEKTRLDLENRDSRIDRLELELEHVKMNPVKRIKTSPEKVQVQSVSGIEKKDWDMLSSLHDSSQKRVKELERQNSDLVKSNEFFKSMHENSEKLREKIRTMEHQVELFGSTRQELAKVQLECQELVRDKEEWFRVCGERGFTSPFQVFEKLNGLKMNEIKLVQEVKELELQLRSFKESSDQDRELSSNALKELETLKALFSEKETILKRSDVRVTILQSENSRLKELLSSYEKEHKLMNHDKHQELLHTRIKDLESTLSEYSSTANQWESKVRLLEKERDDLKSILNQVQEKESRFVSWKKDIVKLIGYDPTTTRVLMLKDNPASRLYNEQMSRLKDTGHGSTSQIATLQKELQSREKTITRLKQVFQAKIQEYRLFVTSLLGYEIEMNMDGKSCTLKSVYNSDEKDPVFYYWIEGENKNVKVMGGSSVSKEIQELLRVHVTNGGDFAGFFASVILLLK